MKTPTTVLLASLALAACGASTPTLTADAGAAAGFSHRIDPSLKAQLPDSARPLAAARSASGAVHVFVANELLVATGDRAQAEALAARVGGTIVGDDAVPEAPAALNLQVDPAYRVPTQYTLRVDASTQPLDGLDEDAAKAGLSGDTAFSDEGAARLLALVVQEKAAGLKTSPNFVFEGGLIDSSEEHPLAPGAFFDPFTHGPFLSTGSKSGVVDLWRAVQADPPARTAFVAVLDNGFWLDGAGRPMSSARPWASDFPEAPVQYDFQEDDYLAGGANSGRCTGGSRCDWHGNGAAGVAVGAFGNRYGGAGTGGQVAQPMLLRTDFDWSHVARAIRTAAAWRADVVSMSFGANCDNVFCDGFFEFNLYPALRNARDNGLVLVAAAGNVPTDSANGKVPCKANEDVICVGALDDGTLNAISYSSSGSAVDLWAPTNILTHPDGDTTPNLKSFGGTSAATPFVAGVAAVLRAYDASLTGAQVNDVLRRTAWRDSADPKVTHALNAYAALRAVAVGLNAPPDGRIVVEGGLFPQLGQGVQVRIAPRDLEDGSPCCTVSWSPAPDATADSGRRAVYTFTSVGVRRLTATLRDSAGALGTATVDVEVRNTAPVPQILQPAAFASVPAGQALQLQGRASDVNEPMGTLACARLTWTSSVASDPGFPVTGCDVTVTFPAMGARVVTLTATDAHGGTASVSRSVTVTAPPVNYAPNVTVGTLPAPTYDVGYASDTTLVVAASATDPEGNTPLSFRWFATTFQPDSTTAVYSSRAPLGPPAATGALAWRPDDTPSRFGTFGSLGNDCYQGQYVRLEVEVTDSLGNARTVALPMFKVFVCRLF